MPTDAPPVSLREITADTVVAVTRLSPVPGPGCPEPFYRAMGFRPTGRMDGREVVLEFPLNQEAP